MAPLLRDQSAYPTTTQVKQNTKSVPLGACKAESRTPLGPARTNSQADKGDSTFARR